MAANAPLGLSFRGLIHKRLGLLKGRKRPASYVWKSRPQPSILASPGVGLCSFRGRRVWLISGAMGGLHGAGSGMRRAKVTVIARRHRISESRLYNWRAGWNAAVAAYRSSGLVCLAIEPSRCGDAAMAPLLIGARLGRPRSLIGVELIWSACRLPDERTPSVATEGVRPELLRTSAMTVRWRQGPCARAPARRCD